jgi:hypothetical protein
LGPSILYPFLSLVLGVLFINVWQVFLKKHLNILLWIYFFSVLSLLIVIFGSVLLPTIATCATFLRKKKQKLQKTENTDSLPPATVGKRIENEEPLATMFTNATQADTFVLSSFVTDLKGMSEMFSERSDSSSFI